MDTKTNMLNDEELRAVTGGITVQEEEPELNGRFVFYCECGAAFYDQRSLFEHIKQYKHYPK